jgi:ribosomal protein RSM22 (predicted rRNA methylase)
MSDLARRLISGWDLNDNLRDVTMHASLPRHPEQYDLVVAANVLAELDHTQAQTTLEILANSVAPDGYLLLIEPGQQQHTRRLMGLRDLMIDNHPSIAPIFPCTRADGCPMLTQSSTDWCHDTFEWRQPPLSAQLDRLLEFNKHRIKYSAFVFKRGATPRLGLRVITPPKKTRLGTEALVCADSFYGITRVRKSVRSERHKPFEKAKVFERLLVSGPLQEDVTGETAFTTASDSEP